MALRIALIQMKIAESKEKTLKNAVDLIRIAMKEKYATVVVLPESFNCPYSEKNFQATAEEIPLGPTSQALRKAARDFGVYIVGGSIAEICCGKLYNTCTVWKPDGELLAKHREVSIVG